MSDKETIEVANVSTDDDDSGGETVELPVLDVLTGRAFLTGKSGSGKSNTASVVAEKLLDRGFSLLLVDIEGEYYGLKEEYEILHAGADEECDIQVSEEHAGKLASLALEQNVPIILDLSGFLDEGDARDLLKAVARQLFAKEKKLKQPFLMVVEEIHEYVPEGGGMDECGKMLVKVAKRGRKHGLGVAGISQRPADVKKDFITQCDWLVWHRLTWQNDTRVVKRVLGDSYADAIEDMGDGEGFLMTDWGEQIRRVQFHRKETFDAGATPGLEDVERPDLKSVSNDLVSELQTISEEQAARDDEIARLENELAEREQRIAELKEELAEARDLSDMAEQFASAMTAQAEPRYSPTEQRDLREYAEREGPTPEAESSPEAEEEPTKARPDIADAMPPEQRAIVEDAAAANGAGVGEVTVPPDGAEAAAGPDDGAGGGEDPGDDDGETPDGPERDAGETGAEPDPGGGEPAPDAGGDDADTPARSASPTTGGGDAPESSSLVQRATEEVTGGDDTGATPPAAAAENGYPGSEAAGERPDGSAPDPAAVAADLRSRVTALDPVARRMLASYRDTGVATPEAVHDAAGESGERPAAYSYNRELRREGFVVHVGGGRYAYALPSLVAADTGGGLDDDKRRQLVGEVEAALTW
jgi:hypothetical protein